MMAQFWSIVCLAGLWGWVTCCICLILTGFPVRGVFAVRPALRWGAATLVCFAVWILGMSQA